MQDHKSRLLNIVLNGVLVVVVVVGCIALPSLALVCCRRLSFFSFSPRFHCALKGSTHTNRLKGICSAQQGASVEHATGWRRDREEERKKQSDDGGRDGHIGSFWHSRRPRSMTVISGREARRASREGGGGHRSVGVSLSLSPAQQCEIRRQLASLSGTLWQSLGYAEASADATARVGCSEEPPWWHKSTAYSSANTPAGRTICHRPQRGLANMCRSHLERWF